MLIWRVWNDYDMAQSDSYFVTKKAALAHVKQAYDVAASAFGPNPDFDDCLRADLPADQQGAYLYLEKLQIEPTRAGIAHALQHIPHR